MSLLHVYAASTINGSITINGGAQYANSSANPFSLELNTSGSTNTISKMIISETNTPPSSSSDTRWEVYSSAKSYTYSGSNGTVTIYAWFMDDTGNISQAYSDSIIYDNAQPGVPTINLSKTQIRYSQVNGTPPQNIALSKIIKDNQGNYYATYYGYANGYSYPHIFVIKSDDGGRTWKYWNGTSFGYSGTEVPVENGYGAQTMPDMAVDTNNNIHLAWNGMISGQDNAGLIYSKFNGTSWSTPIKLSDNIYDINIATDAYNNVHIVFGTNPQTQIKYIKFNGSTWSSPTVIVSQSTGSVVNPAIAVSDNGTIHIMWRKTSSGTSFELSYSKFDGTVWTTPIDITSGGYENSGSKLAIDKNGNLLVVWSGTSQSSPYRSQIRYTKYDGTSWSPIQDLTSSSKDNSSPSIIVDKDNNYYVVWRGANEGDYINQIKYIRFDGITWSSIYNITSGTYDQKGPNTVKDELSVIWNGQTDFSGASLSSTGIMFYKNAFESYTQGTWSNQNVSLALSPSTTTISGVQKMQYRINGGTWQDYSSPVTISTEGISAIDARTLSNSGVVSNISTSSINIDKSVPTSPNINFTYPSGYTSGTWTNTDVKFIVSDGIDSISGVSRSEYRLNNGLWIPFSGEVTLGSSAKIEARTIDRAGIESSIVQKDANIDKATPGMPTINVNLSGTEGYSSVKAGVIGSNPKVVKDNSGNYYVIYSAPYNGYYHIYIRKSIDQGDTWQVWNGTSFVSSGTEVPVENSGSYSQNDPDMAFDSLGNMHVVWTGSSASNTQNQIVYSKYDGSTWTAPITLTNETDSQNTPRIVIDPYNSIYVVWSGANTSISFNKQIRYISNSGTSWSSITDITSASGDQLKPDIIAVGGTLRLVWEGVDSNGISQIWYSRTAFGSGFSSPEHITYENYHQHSPKIIYDPITRIEIAVWSGYSADSPSYSQIRYNTKTRFWDVPHDLTMDSKNQSHPSLYISEGKVNVIWSGGISTSYTQIRTSSFDGTSWSNPSNITSGNYNQVNPSVLSDEFVAVWKGTTSNTGVSSSINGIMLYKSLSNTYQSGQWTNKDVIFTITNGTAPSGVAKYQYRINGGTWQDYSGTVLVNTLGTTTVEAKSISSSGQVSALANAQINIDKDVPVATIVVNSNHEYANSSPLNLTITGSDNVDTNLDMLIKTNDASIPNKDTLGWEALNTAKDYTYSGGDGQVTVYLWVKDDAGNISSAVSDDIMYDGTPATGTVTINNGDLSTDNALVTLSFTKTYEISNVNKIIISNASDFTNSRTFDYSNQLVWSLDGSIRGTKTVYIKYLDWAGNKTDEPFTDTIEYTGQLTYAGGIRHNQVINIQGSEIELTSPETLETGYSVPTGYNLGDFNTFTDNDNLKYRLKFVIPSEEIRSKTNSLHIELLLNSYVTDSIELILQSGTLIKPDGSSETLIFNNKGKGMYSTSIPNASLTLVGGYTLEYIGRLNVRQSYYDTAERLSTFTNKANIIFEFNDGTFYSELGEPYNNSNKTSIETRIGRSQVKYE